MPSPPPGEATGADAAPGPRPLPAPRPNTSDGLSPQEQIARRNQASQADRDVLAASRALAASRLLASVAREPAAGPPANRKAAARPPAPVTTPSNTSTEPRAVDRTPVAPTGATSPNGPLLEVKQSALAADVEHLGERLAIFNDRVELRDRHDVVRQVVMGTDITDIVVNKRLTGAVLTIETVEGPVMVAKGLRPEQAEEARQLIMRKTRPSGPVQRTDRPSPVPAPAPAPSAQVTSAPEPSGHLDVVDPPRPAPSAPASRPIDEADVLRKLGDLHRLGILTTEEYENKIALVGSLVRGEITLPA